MEELKMAKTAKHYRIYFYPAEPRFLCRVQFLSDHQCIFYELDEQAGNFQDIEICRFTQLRISLYTR